MALTPKQKKFCDEYIKCGNATEAAKKAGYNKKACRQIGSENLSKPYIKAYIEKRAKPREKEAIADINEVLGFFTGVMRGEIKDQFDLDAALPERLNAGKELIKRFQVVDKLAQDKARLEQELKQAQIEKAKAEAAIAQNTANKLTLNQENQQQIVDLIDIGKGIIGGDEE